MAGTKAGARKAVKNILAKNPNHYKEAGALGGNAPHSIRPFQKDRSLAIRAGRAGGLKSRRKKNDKPTE